MDRSQQLEIVKDTVRQWGLAVFDGKNQLILKHFTSRITETLNEFFVCPCELKEIVQELNEEYSGKFPDIIVIESMLRSDSIIDPNDLVIPPEPSMN